MVDSHGRLHVEAVRQAARMLAQKYAPHLTRLVDIAASLHDIGRDVDDDHHEIIGHDLVEYSPEYAELRDGLSQDELAQVLEAIREHRASNGNPVGIVAKIVTDADRMGKPPEMNPLRRSAMYHLEQGDVPAGDGDSAIRAAVAHLRHKYGPGGYGLRAFFPETAAWVAEQHAPIFAAADAGDWDTLRRMAGDLA